MDSGIIETGHAVSMVNLIGTSLTENVSQYSGGKLKVSVGVSEFSEAFT